MGLGGGSAGRIAPFYSGAGAPIVIWTLTRPLAGGREDVRERTFRCVCKHAPAIWCEDRQGL